MSNEEVIKFEDLGLDKSVFKILNDVGYETPSPIQAETIPLLLEGKDVLGQAQTGTGKTAAFALPILSRLDLNQRDPQVLVLAPTRELAIQVSEAFQKYATYLKGFHVLPIYGGQDYSGQIRGLKRGVHVVVGTPGRVMDHMRKGTLKLHNLKAMVLDEADEMLKMGFIDDVEWVLEQTPDDRQIALFSATMPKEIRRIANSHLTDPAEVTIKLKTVTAETIRQRFWPVSGFHKLDALTRILEAEEFDAVIIFVRTKTATVDLSEKLEARGYRASALNGDIAQNQRERIVDQLKKGKIDILIATDVAARGLDVKRISHVINYDIPYDAEAYIHRIGRTGRAGKDGEAILFVQPREKRLLSTIERATKKKIEIMELPSTELINDKRVAKFKQNITDTIAVGYLEQFAQIVEQYEQEHDVPAIEIAAALAKLVQGNMPLFLQNNPRKSKQQTREQFDGASSGGREGRTRSRDGRSKNRRDRDGRSEGKRDSRNDRSSRGNNNNSDEGLETFRIEVGHEHQVKPGNIVGAIANEAGLDSQNIGHIKIFDDHSLVDLPTGMPKDVFDDLRHVWVSGQQLKISKLGGGQGGSKSDGKKDSKPKRGKKNHSSKPEHSKSRAKSKPKTNKSKRKES